jgi:hypothetical protein
LSDGPTWGAIEGISIDFLEWGFPLRTPNGARVDTPLGAEAGSSFPLGTSIGAWVGTLLGAWNTSTGVWDNISLGADWEFPACTSLGARLGTSLGALEGESLNRGTDLVGLGDDTSVGVLDGVSTDSLELQRGYRLGVQVGKLLWSKEGVSIGSFGGTGEGTALGVTEGDAVDSIIREQDA